MKTARFVALTTLAVAAEFPACGQSVVSTHSGLVYYFQGSVWIGDQLLEQKFGYFPDIGEGRELRTGQGRAEVLLTPDVFLRLDENSSIRLVSNKLVDTRVELLRGSGIVEAKRGSKPAGIELIYKNWRMRIPGEGVFRIDAEPEQVRVYKGEVEAAKETMTEAVVVKEGELLPLASVLTAVQDPAVASDGFKHWAMDRSQAIAADNSIAAGIVDAPDPVALSGLGLRPAALGGGSPGSFRDFPRTGIPSLGISNLYGGSVWSPYLSTLNSIYYPGYGFALYVRWPGGSHYRNPTRIGLPPHIGTGSGSRPHPGGFGWHPAPASPRLPAVPPRIGPPGPGRIGGFHGGRR